MNKKVVGSIITVIVFICIVICIVILFWPRKPSVRTHINSLVAKDHGSRIVSQVETALSRTKRIFEHKGTLGFRINKSLVENPVPGMHFEKNLNFGDAITLDASFNFTGEIYEVKADINPNIVIEKIYEVAGAKRYYIIVHNFKIKGTNEAQMLARVYPIDAVPQEIPYRKYGTADDIADQLGHYFLKAFVGSKESSLDRKTHLCLSDLSPNLQSLDLTVKGFKMMFRGRGHPECAELSEEECANKTLEIFNKALNEDSDNDHARFGKGLVHLKLAHAAIGTKSAYTVGKHLIRGIEQLDAVRDKNEFLTALMTSPEWKAMLKTVQGFSELELSEAFLKTAPYYREARQAYVEARYDDVPILISNIQKQPKWISGHIAALELSARLFVAKQESELEKLLEQFSKLRDKIDIWVWAPIYGLHLTTFYQNDASKEEEIRHVLDQAIETARDQVSGLDAMALKGRCVATLGKRDEAREYATNVKKRIGDKAERKFRSIYLTLGALYTETGDFDDANIFLKRAIAINISYLRHVQNSPLFSKFRTHESYQSFLLEMSPK